jgi:hypothetical protein
MIVQTVEAEISKDGAIILKEEITLKEINSVFVTVFFDDKVNNNENEQIMKDIRNEQTEKRTQKISNGLHRRNID